MKRRKFMVAGIGAALATGTAQVSRASVLSGRYITVGVGGDYLGIVDALSDIATMVSETSPYLVKLLPGIHSLTGGEIVLPAWVALEGSGQQISTISIDDESTYISVLSNSKISNLSVKAVRSSGSAARGMLVAKRERVLDFYLENVSFALTGGYQSVIEQRWYTHVWYWDNVNIYTDSIGITCKGYQYLRNVNIFMSGNATGTPYYGIFVPGMCRLYSWNLRCGTGYGETSQAGFGTKLEIENDGNVDVVGIFIPGSNSTVPRLELHDLQSYCRNEQVTDISNKINCVRIESGIARMFGCFTQAETPMNQSVAKDLYTASSGTIEIYSCRYTKVDGNLSSRNQQAIAYKTTSNHNERLSAGASTQHAGSVVLCDASSGSFDLLLPADWKGGQPPGMLWTFIKTDESSNTVNIIAPGRVTISGKKDIILSSPYQRIQIVHAGINSNQWFEV